MSYKYKAFTFIIALMLILSGCAKKSSPNIESEKKLTTDIISDSKNNTSSLKLSDFMPKKLDMQIKYIGGFENGGEEAYVEYIEGNKVQLKSMNGGASLVKVLELKEDSIWISYSKEEVYEKVNYLNMDTNRSEIFLKAPLTVGNSWLDSQGNKKTITAVDFRLETKAGIFNTIEVSSETNGDMLKQYFAPNLGLIKNEFKTKDTTFITEIQSINENTPFINSYRFFYYNGVKDKIYYVDKQMPQVETSKLIDLMKSNMMAPPDKELAPDLKGDIKINKIELNREKDLIHIDLSDNFVKEMNLGSGPEVNVLQAIVNTLGYNYYVGNVLITLENKPYSSGHILMKPGETFKVDYKNNVKYKN